MTHNIEDLDVPGTVLKTVGFEVIRNDHRRRIRTYAANVGADYLTLLGLYLVMASKPHGWRFDAGRLAVELPGSGRDRVLALLGHLRTLGYYSLVTVRGDDGRTTRTASFDAGTTWPAQALDVPAGHTKNGPPDAGPVDNPVPVPRRAPETPPVDTALTSTDETFPQVTPKTGHQTLVHQTLVPPTNKSVPRSNTESQSGQSVLDVTTDLTDLTDDDPMTERDEDPGGHACGAWWSVVIEELGAYAPTVSPRHQWAQDAYALWQHLSPSEAVALLTADMSPRTSNPPGLIRSRLVAGPPAVSVRPGRNETISRPASKIPPGQMITRDPSEFCEQCGLPAGNAIHRTGHMNFRHHARTPLLDQRRASA